MITRHLKTPIMHRIVEANGILFFGGIAADDMSLDMAGQTRQVLEKLGIGGFEELDFGPIATASAQERSAYAAELVRAGSALGDVAPARDGPSGLLQPGMGIDEAKAGLAARFGVAAEQIDITIRW